MSYPALYTHTKTKHDKGDLTNNRGRGRPKKDTGESFTNNKYFYNPMTVDYFKHTERTGFTSDLDLIVNLKSVIEDLFFINFSKNENKLRKNFSKASDHAFYMITDKYVNIKPYIDLDADTCKCDEVLAEYIFKTKELCNPIYLQKVIKFVLLFREHVNIVLGSKQNLGKEVDYTSVQPAEDAPDVSNEFITEYLDVDEERFGLNKDEAIDLTMNLCLWMYNNNYSCSKLILANQVMQGEGENEAGNTQSQNDEEIEEEEYENVNEKSDSEYKNGYNEDSKDIIKQNIEKNEESGLKEIKNETENLKNEHNESLNENKIYEEKR